MDGDERDGAMGSARAGILARNAALAAVRSGDAPASAAAGRGEPPPAPQCLMMAGSRLRVWRSLLLVMALDVGEEQEKTLLRRPCAADMSPGSRLRSAHFSAEPSPAPRPSAHLQSGWGRESGGCPGGVLRTFGSPKTNQRTKQAKTERETSSPVVYTSVIGALQ